VSDIVKNITLIVLYKFYQTLKMAAITELSLTYDPNRNNYKQLLLKNLLLTIA
jgi:hypothetical protein